MGIASRCPNCGAENPESRKFCGDCGSRIPEPSPSKSESPITPQKRVRRLKPNWKATPASASCAPSGRKRKMILVVAIVAILAVVSMIAAALVYYHPPVRGIGSPSSTTIVKGQSVQFDFSPSQGTPPYSYLWTFGDGSTSTAKSPTHTYADVGTYTVTVVVTDKAGMKCSWTTRITVRHALVFIDQISYPSWVAFYPLGDTYCKLFVDGTRTLSPEVELQPGTTHSIRLQIIGVIDLRAYGGSIQETTLLDETGTITTPTTQTDLHCALKYDPNHNTLAGIPTFTLVVL